MGKNRTRESLSREVANVIVHEIVREHTNKPESIHFLESETIEYRNKAEKISETYNWNSDDKEYIQNKSLILIREKLATKYSDIEYFEEEAVNKINEVIQEIM
jgi:hypothetical protein